jgi:Dyp-type peroxidase family
MITAVAPLPVKKVVQVRDRISSALGNPALDIVRAAIESGTDNAPFVHFVSLHALTSPDGDAAWLVLELSADGSADEALENFARRLDAVLQPILAESSDWKSSDSAAAFLKRHVVTTGTGYFDPPGLNFCGTPGQSVVDALREERLAARIGELLSVQRPGQTPLQRLADIRESLRGDPAFGWALDPPPPPVPAPRGTVSFKRQLAGLAGPFVPAFLWPLLVIVVPLAFVLAMPGRRPLSGSQVAVFFLHWAVYTLLAVAGFLLTAYIRFRSAETSDWVSERRADPRELQGILERENAPGFVQNHMISLTVLKPGLLRQITIRLAFWAVARLTAKNPRPGFLGDIGTIHFARWVTIPGTRILLFFSNFGGSWESYLEDFITKAHAGLTGVWSNTVGFPRAKNLFFDGATDGDRFKRYARQSMSYTPFWYSAYPNLTTDNIRQNRLIRRGVAAAMTQDEAVRWLALYGSRPRPVEKLEVTQIQSLIFGGLGFKPAGVLLALQLPDTVAETQSWLGAILPHIAFGDGRYLQAPAVFTFGVSAAGLQKLGLPETAVATFPTSFLNGMAAPGRSRILGDTGRNAPDNWRWGYAVPDVALLIYGDSSKAVSQLVAEVERSCDKFGAAVTVRIPLREPSRVLTDRKEPFGFVDGVSQPAMRGTYRGFRNDDPIHLVEPGEIVLGYPDNRGSVPPGPHLDAGLDPEQLLPIDVPADNFGVVTAEQPRAIGQNGSFLVIRQLEQDFEGFKSFCAEEATRVLPYFADLPVFCDEEFIAAKMIGRWHDGSSLVRHPYVSATKLRELSGRDSTGSTARPETRPSDPTASSIGRAEFRAQSAYADRAPRPDNDFLYGTEDPQGLRCPYGAHIRRANPRDSLSPGSNEQIEISNRHRILRVGRQYEEKGSRGLLFMCLNADLERQFEFIQQTWMSSSKFHGLDAETDPIVTDGTKGRCSFTIPTRAGPVPLNPLPQFVTMRGGGYFFLPGRQLLNYLARPPLGSNE